MGTPECVEIARVERTVRVTMARRALLDSLAEAKRFAIGFFQ